MDNVMRLVLFASTLVPAALAPVALRAAACTPGADCYCDRVTSPSSPIHDPALLMCEDFEAPTLRLNQGMGDDAPFYGPPYDNGGMSSPNNRGHGGYWNRVYGNGTNNVLWAQGEPANPKQGAPCGYSLCTGLKIWSVGDLWDANAYDPVAAFLTDGEYTAEPHLTAPIGKSGGGSGSFDGAASLFSRVPAGGTAGIFGEKSWNKTRTFGITGAVAYAPNLVRSGVVADMWKGDEWNNDGAMAGGDGLFLFGYAGFNTRFPFYQFTFSNGTSQAACNARLAAATRSVGTFWCDAAGSFIWEADSEVYDQATDWPLGTWACVRAYFREIGTASSSIEMWVTGPSGVEKKVVDISNMDLTGHAAGKAPAGYRAFIWNNYANANQPGGSGPTGESSGRYQDNYHIRAGAPVSCAQIGYAGASVRPSAPRNLRVE